MPTRTIPLSKSVQGTVNAQGGAVLSIGPVLYSDVWTVNSAHMQADTSTKEATGSLYLGPASANNLQGSTQSASTGDTAQLAAVQLHMGHTLTAVWTGADVGTTATLTVYGTRTITGG